VSGIYWMPFPILGPSRPLRPPNRASFEYRFDGRPISSAVTAVTGRDGFAVDLTFVQTYSQAQGDV
jgi:hypothetical protein